MASESSKQYLICQVTSLKEAISENGFDHSEAKKCSISKFLAFSDHLDIRLPTTLKKLEI